jgi:hypothetical protein
MPVGIEAWLTEVPPVTRAWLALSVGLSIATVCFSRISSRATLTAYPAMPFGGALAIVF